MMSEQEKKTKQETRGMRQRGGIMLLWMGFLPFMVAGLVILINIGSLFLSQLRLQISADRAAFAGAASLAHSLNEIAKNNAAINRERKSLEADFNSGANDNDEGAQNKYRNYEKRKVELEEKNTEINQEMWSKAMSKACSLARRNLNDDVDCIDIMRSSAGDGMIGLLDNEKYQYADLKSGNVVSIYIDPTSYSSKTFRALKYYKKNQDTKARLGIELSKEWKPFFVDGFEMAGLFEGWKMKLNSWALSQPFGGSVEEYARTESQKWLYKPLLFLPERR